MTEPGQIRARVKAVHDDIVTIALLTDDEGSFYPIIKNEVVLICPKRSQARFEEKHLSTTRTVEK